ncbi:MAG: hypothetical protein ABI543_11605 [Ignavibacteria bacterium]
MLHGKKYSFISISSTGIKIFLVFAVLLVNLPSLVLGSVLMESSFCKMKSSEMKCCKQMNNSDCGDKKKKISRNRECPCIYISQADDLYADSRSSDKTSVSLKSFIQTELSFSDNSPLEKTIYNNYDLPPPKGGTGTYLLNNNFRI